MKTNMKVVLLCGGFGSRISEESLFKPKPMIRIGEDPILIHIMKIYASQGYKNFVICGGYKQNVIKEYFNNFDIYNNDVVFDFKNCKNKILHDSTIDWEVTVSDTGLMTQTGGRIKKIQKYIKNNRFMLTYGDAVCDIDLEKLLKSHLKSKKIATISVYNFGQTKGVVELSKKGIVKSFREKSNFDGDLINIGFMVFEPKVFNLIKKDSDILENDILSKLAKMGQLNAYIHKGFWQCMDTMREKELLEKFWNSTKCPWKIWD